MVMAQGALATASGPNEELYGKRIAQAESFFDLFPVLGCLFLQLVQDFLALLESLICLEPLLLPLGGCKPICCQERAATGRDRTASWKRFGRSVHGQANPEKWDKEDPGDIPEPQKPRKLEPKRHPHLRSERRRADEAR